MSPREREPQNRKIHAQLSTVGCMTTTDYSYGETPFTIRLLTYCIRFTEVEKKNVPYPTMRFYLKTLF